MFDLIALDEYECAEMGGIFRDKMNRHSTQLDDKLLQLQSFGGTGGSNTTCICTSKATQTTPIVHVGVMLMDDDHDTEVDDEDDDDDDERLECNCQAQTKIPPNMGV